MANSSSFVVVVTAGSYMAASSFAKVDCYKCCSSFARAVTTPYLNTHRNFSISMPDRKVLAASTDLIPSLLCLWEVAASCCSRQSSLEGCTAWA